MIVVAPTRNLPVTDSEAHHARDMRVVWALLILYAIGFACFFPSLFTNYDEVSYVRQAVAFSHGRTTLDVVDPITGNPRQVVPWNYPAGNSTLMVPLVWMAGWRGAFALGLIALIMTVLCTAKWIAEAGHSPLFALVILGYPPTLVLARMAMSDVPSALLVSFGLWMFWRGEHGSAWMRLLAGFIAGVSICLREPNAFLFAFFFAGALLRKERGLWALILGGSAGVACRLISSVIVYGDAFFAKPQYPFTGAHAGQNLEIYLAALLILVPGGLICAFSYRGSRWPELVATVAAFLTLFVLYDYNAGSSSGFKQWVLASRFFIPLLPILAFAMAHTAPRWVETFLRSRPPLQRPDWAAFGRAAVVCWLAGIAISGWFINWWAAAYAGLYRQVAQQMYLHTDPSELVVTDTNATVKFFNEMYERRPVTGFTDKSEDDLRTIIERRGVVQLMFFDREDSDFWLLREQENQALVNRLASQFQANLTIERRFPTLGVLRIWKIARRS